MFSNEPTDTDVSLKFTGIFEIQFNILNPLDFVIKEYWKFLLKAS